jgi:hypothetical protein
MQSNFKIEKIIASFKKAKDEYEKTMKMAASELTGEIFKEYPDIKVLRIIGETPAFNDGDPCEHSANLYINGFDYGDYRNADGGYGDCDESEDELEEFKGKLKNESEISEILCNNFSDLYGTNFIVNVQMVDGKVSVTDTYYEPEY